MASGLAGNARGAHHADAVSVMAGSSSTLKEHVVEPARDSYTGRRR